MTEYWNREFETMPWDEIHKYWMSRLPAHLEYLKSNSDFYRSHLASVGVGELTSFDAIVEWPTMTKNDVRSAQAETSRAMPLGSIQVAATEDIVQVISSSGTTGRRVYYGITWEDMQAWHDAIATFAHTAGIRRSDIVAHAVGIPIYAGGEPYFAGMRQTGACVVWVGGQTTTKVLETVRDMHCNVFHGTASFGLLVAEQCQDRLGISPFSLGIDKVIGGGEPGLGEEVMRRKVKEAWGAETVRDTMGLADVLPGLWAECEEESGMHFTAQKHVMVELVDPATGEHLPWEPGATGEPVYTPLARQATPLVRYRSRDQISVLGVDCRCGRTTPRVRCVGRTDDMLIYKAMNVFPSAIRDVVVSNFEPSLTGYVQVVRNFEGQVRFDDPIPVDVEVKPSIEDTATLKKKIESLVRDLLNVRVDANLVAPGTIERTDYKSAAIRTRK